VLFPWPEKPAWFAMYDHLSFWGGVDLFFVVSGYVVATRLLRDLDGARGAGEAWPAMKRFWIRRAFRLFPLAWTWLVIVLLASAFFNRSGIFGEPSENARQALWIFFYVYNWIAFPLFQGGVNIQPLGVFWSLSIEEQFYLLLPVALVFVPRRGLLLALAAAIALQFFIWRPGPFLDPMWGLRSDALAWGVLIAFMARGPWHERARPRWLANAALAYVANALLLAVIVSLSMPLLKVSITTGLFIVACAAWVWLASYESGYVLPAKSLRPVMLWLGSRSYSLYLAHMSVYMFANEIVQRVAAARGVTSDPSWAPLQVGLAFVLLLAVAEAGYRYLEMPLRNYGRRLAAA
jgi:peptidoglycan/LPS O-acetylase OafA/YrhL